MARLAPLIVATMLVAACSISANISASRECGQDGTHSHFEGSPGSQGSSTAGDESGQVCVCDAGFDWCNPDNDQDFNCCVGDELCPFPNTELADGQCQCLAGFDWCNPTDPNDYSCCEASSSTSSTTTESTSSGPVTTDTDTSTSTDTSTDTGTETGTGTGTGTDTDTDTTGTTGTGTGTGTTGTT